MGGRHRFPWRISTVKWRTIRRRRSRVMSRCPVCYSSPHFVFNVHLLPVIVAAWKHRFSSRCMSVVQEQAFGARPASYKAIQDLDKKVRNFYVPPSLRVPGFGNAKIDVTAPPPSVELTMQRYIAFAIREISKFSFLLRQRVVTHTLPSDILPTPWVFCEGHRGPS